jgi:hypothetical protein
LTGAAARGQDGAMRVYPSFVLGAALAACGGGGDDAAAIDADPGDDANAGDAAAAIDAAAVDAPAGTGNFSFFVTSLDTMRLQSGSQNGFGGNLGGLAGADAICQTAAAAVGFGHKTWRAFLSVYNNGAPIHAIDRIGNGPWYDRQGRLVAMDRAGLLMQRPAGDAAVVNDLPDETGQGTRRLGDTHDVMTGSNTLGQLDGTSAANTCNDWTSVQGPGTENLVRCGHAWPAMSGMHWIQAHRLRGCEPGINLVQNGGGTGYSVGAGGGWGAIYCFALQP